MYSTNIYFVAFWKYDPETKKVRYIFETKSASNARTNRDVLTETDGVEVFLPFVVEEDREKFLNLYRSIDSGTNFTETEIRCFAEGEIHDDNNIRYVLIRLRRVKDPCSGRDIAYGFAIDTTSRVIHQRKYRHAYRDFLNLSPEAIKIVHLDLTANQSYPIKGKDLNEFRGNYRLMESFKSADEYFETLINRIDDPELKHQMTPRLNRESLIAIFRNGNENFELEYLFKIEDGSQRWLKTKFFLIQNPETYNIEAFVTTFDVDKRKKMAQISWLIPNCEFDFVGLVDLKKNNLEFFLTKQGTIYSRLQRILDFKTARQYTIDNLIAPEYREFFDKEIRIPNMIEQMDRLGSFTFAFKVIDKEDQSSRLVRSYWLDDSREFIVILQSNVSNLFERELEEFREAQKSVNAAEKSNKIRAEFVSRITHDIRTPISLVNSMVDFAFEDIDNRQKLIEDLEKIRSTGKLLLALVNDVLDISKIESGKIVLQPTACDLNEVITDIRNIFESQCQQKNIEFKLNTEGEEFFESIIADRVRITQILMNLISNAVKYSLAEGRVEVSIIAKAASEETCAIRFIISDDGIGMSESFQEKMFVPFEQDYENPLRDPKTVSTGLGLPIVKNLIDLMGGKIEVKSEFGHGTRFTIDLEFPIAKKIDAKTQSEASRVKNIQAALNGRKILFAEDNELNAEIGQRILEMFGIICICVPNGAIALKRFQESNIGEFDAILMDLQMPILDGYQATELIRALKRPDAEKIPIIAMTADAFHETTEATRKVGMNAHLTKPIEPDKLLEVLDEFID